jgi:D-glycero-D-manno-heptose 1,7-bisphosphate phosphatase
MGGAYIDAIYYCPHHPEEGFPPYRQLCRCRKPETGLIEEAVKKFDIDCSQSYMIGDRGIDIEFGHKIGAKSILVLTGYGKGELEYCRGQWKQWPDYVAKDLYEAVEWIIKQEDERLNILFKEE